MKLLQKIIPVLFIASLFYACDEEEYVYPDVLTEILNLETDAQ